MRKLLLLSLLLISLFAHGQMTVETFTLKATGDKITFLKYLPAGYVKTKKYPVLVSLSGDGEKSSAGISALQGSGINKLLINGSLSLPFIVVSPQTPYANYDNIGSDGTFKPGVFATEMLDTAIARYNGDPTKTYIAGLSMGGPSVPNALAFFPTRWAAGISIASWETDIQHAALIKGALWDIKVDQDPTAGSPAFNTYFIESCKNSAKAQYTVIKGSGHFIWDQVYSDSWESMSISTDYPGSVKQSNVYTWLSQFTTSGTTSPVTMPSQIPVVTPAVASITYQPLGKIEAESYVNFSNVSTESCSDSGGTLDVGWIRDGSYMDYAVNVPQSGQYLVSLRYASTAAGIIQFRNSAGVPLDTISIPVTGAWQKWATLTKTITLTAGPQILRVFAQKAGFNLNWINFVQTPQQVVVPCASSVLISNPSGAKIVVNGSVFQSDFIILPK